MKITIINGGSGAKNIIKALIKIKKIHITSIINTFDDGKSTGLIRKFFKMPGPSDIRKVHSLFLNEQDENIKQYKDLYSIRLNHINRKNVFFEMNKYIEKKSEILFGIYIKNKKVKNFIIKNLSFFLTYLLKVEKNNSMRFNFNDCSLMNCIYAGSYINNKKNITKVIYEFEQIFRMKGRVIPITNKNLYLSALLNNNQILASEDLIINNNTKKNIKKLFLTRIPANKIIKNKINNQSIKYLEMHNYNYAISKEVRKCLNRTNILVFAPGTQYSSLFPTYACKGFGNSISSNKNIIKILFTNIQNEKDTFNYSALDYVNKSLDYLSIKNFNERIFFFNYILVNKSTIKDKTFKFVKNNIENKMFNSNLIFENFTDKNLMHDIKKIYKFISKF